MPMGMGISLGLPLALTKGGGLSPFQQQLMTGLEAWWQMEESNANRLDASGKGKTLTDRSTTASAAGKVGNAGDFSSDYMDVDLLTSVASFSVSFWVKFTGSAQGIIVNKNNFSTSTAGFYIQHGGSDGRVAAAWFSTIARAIYSSKKVTSGVWYHVAFTFDAATTTGRLVLDGEYEGSLVGSMGSPPSNLFTLGRFTNGSIYFAGQLDMVGVWSRALTPREIRALYNAGSPITYPFTGLTEADEDYAGPYRVIWITGQSNAVALPTGGGTVTADRSYPPRTKQIKQTTYELIDPFSTIASSVAQALDHNTISSGENTLGLGLAIARIYAATIDASIPLLIVPSAAGSTSFEANNWNPGNTLYETEIARVIAAMDTHPDNELLMVYSGHGEGDTVSSAAATAFAGRVDTWIADWRSRVPGATTAPLVCGGMVPGWVGANADRLTVQAAIAAVGVRNRYAAYADPAASPSIGAGTDIHYTPADYRGSDGLGGLALKAVNAIAVAVANTP